MLIQKDTKQLRSVDSWKLCLRALLIQKDTKHEIAEIGTVYGLRALLIQKDTKLINYESTWRDV